MAVLTATSINQQFVKQLDAQAGKFLTKDKTDKRAIDYIKEFTESAYGAFRSLQLVERTAKAANMVFQNLGPSFAPHAAFSKDVAKGAMTAWCWLSLPRLFASTEAMVNSLKNLFTGAKSNKLEDVDNVADGLATFGYAASVLPGCAVGANIAAVPDLVHQAAGAIGSAMNYREAQKLHQYSCTNLDVKEEVHDALKHTMRYNLLVLAKSVVSVVSGVLGLALLAFGGPILPAVILLTMSMAGTVLAISGSLYKSTHKVLNFQQV